MIKVQLIVVQGKPEGKTIPLMGPVFRIGRDPSCHLRPSSDQVSRTHSEFAIIEDSVVLKDLGSRNGTILNGRAIAAPVTLKSGDLIKIGHLTFAISIQGGAATQPTPVKPSASTTRSLDEVPPDQVESWLIADNDRPVPDRPSGVYDGETITINAFKEGQASGKSPSSRDLPTVNSKAPAAQAPSKPPSSRELPVTPPKPTQVPTAPKPATPMAETPAPNQPVAPAASAPAPTQPAASAPAPTQPAASAPAPNQPASPAAATPAPAPPEMTEAEPSGGIDPSYLKGIDFGDLAEGEALIEARKDPEVSHEEPEENQDEGEATDDTPAEEFIDESNPFYTGRKQNAEPEVAESKKPSYKDSSDAANDILKRMLERRRNR